MDQAIKFEEVVVPSKFTLFFDCPEKVMEERLLDRGKTSGRADDNIESIKKRFKTFEQQTMPVVEYFEKDNRCVKVSAIPPPEEVYEHVKKVFEEKDIQLVKK
jgi:UMP-CMP kinase